MSCSIAEMYQRGVFKKCECSCDCDRLCIFEKCVFCENDRCNYGAEWLDNPRKTDKERGEVRND